MVRCCVRFDMTREVILLVYCLQMKQQHEQYIIHMSQMLYADQSAQEIVTFLSDFCTGLGLDHRAKFMAKI